MWLPTQFMYRFEKNGTPTALKDFIEEITPYDQWKPSRNALGFVEELKGGFQNAIGKDFFVDNFTIQKDKNTLFCLFFFTPHIRGFEKMLESKWKIDSENGRGWKYSWSQQNLFAEQTTNKLEYALERFLSKTARSNGEIYEFTLRSGFLPKHATEIFSAWQEVSKISVLLPNGQNARKKSFYISYTNYRDAYSKVNIRLN